MASSASVVTSSSRKNEPCANFTPHSLRTTLCRNCYRTQAEHSASSDESLRDSGLSNSGATAATPPVSSGIPVRNPESPGTRRTTSKDDTPKSPSPRAVGGSTRKTPSPKGEDEALGARRAVRSMVFERSASGTPTNMDPRYVEELENDFFELEDKYVALMREKCDITAQLEERTRQAEVLLTEIEGWRSKVAWLEKRCLQLDAEVKSYRDRLSLPESEQLSYAEVSGMVSATPRGDGEDWRSKEELRRRLDEVEALCHELIEENEALKEEVEEMQKEIEEMHDHFQDDDADTLREVQRDLEQANKNCRIFQFKLRKAERRYEQCETERASLQAQLSVFQPQAASEIVIGDLPPPANESFDRLVTCLDLCNEPPPIGEEIAERPIILQMSTGIAMAAPPGRESSSVFEPSQLARELDSSREREEDLAGQLRHAENEAHTLKRRLVEAEEENDTVNKRLQRALAQLSATGLTNIDLDVDVEGDQGHIERFQVQLIKEENNILRKKVMFLENENETLIIQLNERDGGMVVGSSVNTFGGMGGALQQHQPKTHRRFPLQKSHSLDNALACSTRLDVENQLELLRREVCTLGEKLNRSNTEKERLAKENERLLNLSPSKHLGKPTESYDANSINQVKAKLADFDRRLKQVSRDFLIKCSLTASGLGGEDNQQDLLSSYHDAREGWREAELEIGRLRKRLAEYQDENDRYQKCEGERRAVIEKHRERRLTKMELNTASRDVLFEEMKHLEDEVLEVSCQLEAARAENLSLKEESRRRTQREDEARTELERRERDMAEYVREMENKNALLSDLLEIVQDRANALQDEYDKLIGEKTGTPGGGSVSAVSPLSGVSTGSDEVFSEQSMNPAAVDESLRSRVRCLERLLAEERQRVQVAEKKLEMANMDAPIPPANYESQVKQREVEFLKRELEEKEDVIEEKESQLSDLRSRLDQTRKMNDAMRTLVETEQEDNQDSNKRSPPSQGGNHEHQIEVISYKKEIEDLRNELTQMTQRMHEAERSSDKLGKEVKMLSQELRQREDALFEADDELEKKNNEIMNLSRTVDEERQEVEKIRTELKTIYEELTLLKKFEEQVTQLSEENGHLTSSLEETRNLLAQREIELSQLEDQLRVLSDAVRNRDDRIREKDDHIQHINNRLQNREKELTDLENLLQQTTYKLNRAEDELKELRAKLSNQDKDFKALTSIVEEIRVTSERQAAEIEILRRESDRRRGERSSSSQSDREKVSLEEENRRLRQLPVSASPGMTVNIEMEKLKKDLQAMRKEKLEQQVAWSREKHQLEKKLSRVRDDSIKDIKLTSTNDPKKMAARILLLSEHISRLNCVQIELKIQNESLQGTIIDHQRRQRNLMQQYETEQTKWLNEKSLLEMRAKDQEDRKVIIANTRKSLQETALKVADLEALCNTQQLDFDKSKSILEREKMDLQARLNIYEEKEKVPKVLQRFSRAKTPVGPSEAAWDRERNELRARLDATEKGMNKLRSDVIERENKWALEKQELLKGADQNRLRLERQLEQLRQQVIQVDSARNQVEAYQARLEEYEESAERERRMWQEDRMQLQYKVEEDRLLLDQWLTRVKAALAEFEQSETYEKCDIEPLSDDTMNLVEGVRCLIDDMEKFTRMRDRTPFMQIKKSYPMTSSFTESPVTPSPMSPPGGSMQRPTFSSLLNIGPRTSSLDWTNFQPRLTGSLGRVGRSVSPDVSVGKVSPYPDPPAGFLLQSRQSSADSLGSAASLSGPYDYTTRSSTMPNTRPVKCRMSPARQKFYDEYDSRISATPPPSTSPSNTNLTDRFRVGPGAANGSTISVTSANERDAPRSILSSSQSSLTHTDRRKVGGSRSITFDPTTSPSGLPPPGPSTGSLPRKT